MARRRRRFAILAAAAAAGTAAAAAAAGGALAIPLGADALGLTRPLARGCAAPHRPPARWAQLRPGRPLTRASSSSGGGSAPGGSTSDRAREASDWRLNVGRAIDVLQRDVAALFSNGPGDGDAGYTPDFSVFSEDVALVDARAPDFQLHGLVMYRRAVSALQWSVRAASEHSRMEIVATRPPVDCEVYMRWRLHLWPREVLAMFSSAEAGKPSVVEGYFRYQFDPWSAEIVKHTIDITNPPTLIEQLLFNGGRQVAMWGAPAAPGIMTPAMIQQTRQDAFRWTGERATPPPAPRASGSRRSKLDQAAKTWAKRSHVIAIIDD